MTTAVAPRPLRPGAIDTLFRRRYGNRAWDRVIRGTGVAAAAAVPVALAVPAVAPLLGFLLVTSWVHGPVSALFPGLYEPVVMTYGRMYAPLAIGALGTAGVVSVEYLNHQLYRGALDTSLLSGFRDSALGRWVTVHFRRAPFLTIWLCGAVLPYWPIRIVAPLAHYPVGRQLVATALGRFPRLTFFAALGSWVAIDVRVFFALAAGVGLVAGLVVLARRLTGRRFR